MIPWIGKVILVDDAKPTNYDMVSYEIQDQLFTDYGDSRQNYRTKMI